MTNTLNMQHKFITGLREQVILNKIFNFLDVKRKTKPEKPSKKFVQVKPSVNKKSYEQIYNKKLPETRFMDHLIQKQLGAQKHITADAGEAEIEEVNLYKR